jgi:hypothetical protein
VKFPQRFDYFFSKKMICQGVYSQPSQIIDNEVIEDSNNAVSGGAVYNAIQAIPSGGPTIQIYTDILERELIDGGGGWTVGGTLFRLGNLIYGYMNFETYGNSVNLSFGKKKCATLKPEIPLPMSETPFQVIHKKEASTLGDGLHVDGYIDVDGSVYFSKGEVTLASGQNHRVIVFWATTIPN